MRSGIGSLLRAERERRGIELTEVEAATRIRAELLEAIEAEDWDRIPGDAYARAFARTYSSYLSVDVEPFLDQPPQAAAIAPLPATGNRARRRRRNWLPAAIAALALVLAVIVVVIVSGGGGGSPPDRGSAPSHDGSAAASRPAGAEGSAAAGEMALELTTTAELWVCLLDAKGKPLVDGIVLPEGTEEGPFRSGSFTVSFGNGEVEMRIDGRETEIPESGSPLGYAIGRGGELSPLAESERPTCT